MRVATIQRRAEDGQQRDDSRCAGCPASRSATRASGVDAVAGAKPRGVAAVRAALQHRMADERGRQAVAGEERRLERQQAEQRSHRPG